MVFEITVSMFDKIESMSAVISTFSSFQFSIVNVAHIEALASAVD